MMKWKPALLLLSLGWACIRGDLQCKNIRRNLTRSECLFYKEVFSTWRPHITIWTLAKGKGKILSFNKCLRVLLQHIAITHKLLSQLTYTAQNTGIYVYTIVSSPSIYQLCPLWAVLQFYYWYNWQQYQIMVDCRHRILLSLVFSKIIQASFVNLKASLHLQFRLRFSSFNRRERVDKLEIFKWLNLFAHRT